MPCPTCDHTLQRVNGGEPKVFWCPRCGTLKTDPGVPDYEQPMLVKRVLMHRGSISDFALKHGGIDDCLPLKANALGGMVTIGKPDDLHRVL